jgi:hypothetical protein
MEKSHVGGSIAGVVNIRNSARRGIVRRRAIGDGTAGMGRSCVGGGVAGVWKSRVGCGTARSAIRRRAIGGGMAGVRKSRMEDDARRSAARRCGAGGSVVEEEVWLHRKSSHGREEKETVAG